MAGQVGKLTLKAVIEGFEEVQGLGKALKQVQGIANQSDASFKNITTRVKEFARQNVKTTDSIRGQIGAFTRLRGSVGVASSSYTTLTKNIQQLRRELVGLDTAEEKRAKKQSLRQMGMSDTEIRRAMRTESQIYQRALGKNVWDQTTRSVRQGILDQRVADNPIILDGKVSRDYINSFREATTENEEFAELQNRVNLRLQTTLNKKQVSSQFSTPTVLGPEDDRRFIKRTPRYPGEYGPIFDPTNKDIFTKIIRGSLGVMGEAFPGRKGVGLTGFKPGFTADPDARDNPADWIKDWKRPMDVARQIVDRRMGGGKRRTSIRAQWGENLRDSDDLFVPENVKKWQTHTDRLPGYRKGRIGTGTKYDTWRSRTEVDAPVFYSDIATGDVRARGGRLGKMVGGPKDLGPSYPQTPAGDAANIAALNKQLANLKTNSDGAKKVREKLLEIENRSSREMRKAQGVVGDLTRKENQRIRVQEKLAKIRQETGGGTGFSGRQGYKYQTRKDIGGGRFEYEERQDAGWARPQVSRDPVTGAMIAPSASGGYAPGSFRMPVPTQVREISGLYNQIANIGMSKINADIDRMGKSYEEVRKDILAASKAGNKSVQSLTAQKSAFVQLRDGMNPASKGFKQLTKDIQNTDKALMRLSANKFSGANLRRTGQSILGAGFVGGPAGFLGAGLGAGIEALRPGGDMAGGAITGGLVASQVLTPISQAIGGATNYASDIEKAQIALRGITKTSENYEVAQKAITKAVEVYNVPQEVAIKGMTRLSAAVLGANGNIYNAAEAFLNTTVAIKGTAGSADDVKSAITAMVQIYSKGKVSAEELSGQLGERFPAAVTKFAKANNISTQQLQKQLKDGTVGLDMLSKFVTSLGEEYAPLAEKIAKSNEEAGARSRIAMNKMKIAVGTELKDVGAQFQIIGANLLTSLVPALATVGNIGADVFGALAGTIQFVIDNFHEFASVAAVAGGVMAGLAIQALAFKAALEGWNLKLLVGWIWKKVLALKALTIAQIKMNIAAMANPYVLIAAGLTATAIWAFKAAQAHDQLVASLESGVATEDDVNKAFEERLKLQKEMVRIATSNAFKYRDEKERAAAIEKLNKKYDELTKAIEAYRKGANDPHDFKKLKKEFESLMGTEKVMSQKMMDLEINLLDARGKGMKLTELKLKRDIDILKITEKIEENEKASVTQLHEQAKINKQFEIDKAKILEVSDQMLFKMGDITKEELAKRDAAREALVIYHLQDEFLEGQKRSLKEITDLLLKQKEANKFEGFMGGIDKWAKNMKSVGEQVADATAGMFDRMADSLTNFVMTGKLQFKEFARSVIADLSKIIIKQMMLNALTGFKSWLGGGQKTTTVAQVTGMVAAKGGVFAQNGIVPYAKGGIVDKPTLFPFSRGIGLMGEAGPEAIVPLKRGKDGKLGIAGGGGSTVVNVSVDAKGTKVEGDTPTASQLGKLIGVAVKAELIKEQRPGGLLSN
jgi:lambda family phage tail tape measure protein